MHQSHEDERGGAPRCSSAYRAQEWRDSRIKARRFAPCPHCGGAVSGRERIWTPPYAGEGQRIFREARCENEACGWHYFKHEGTREEFIAETNRRATEDGRNQA